MKIISNVPLNNVSFGHVSFCIMREFWKKNIQVDWFPMSNNTDVSSFDKAETEFLDWLKACGDNAIKNYKADSPTFRLWHIGGAQHQIGRNQYLFTFHECDQITDVERNILNNQRAIFVSSNETKNVFETYGVKVPVIYVPLGYDSLHFKPTGKKYYSDNVTSWFIGGKFEKRKATERVIRAWIAKFGNDRNHILNTMIHNPFIRPEDNDAIFNNLCGGKKIFNINRLPYVKNLTAMNEIMNSADIVLDCSLSEAWSLPSFHAVGLGKHAILHNASAIKEWGNADNAILIESNGKTPAKDGMFFHDGQPFNQGNFWNFDDAELPVAFDKVLTRKNENKVNEAGKQLVEKFKWEDSVSKILEVMENK